MPIDFAGIAERLLGEADSLLAQWFPEGKREGCEFKVGDLGGSPGESLSINLDTGRWADFAAGVEGGDLISLYAAIHGIKQSEAAKQLSNGHDHGAAPARPKPAPSSPEKPRIDWTPIMPVPDGTPAPRDDYYRKISGDWTKLKFIRRWTYLDAQGRTMGHVCRFEMFDADGVLHKDIIPQVWCSGSDGTFSWRWRSMTEPRPLYNLAALLARPDAPVLVVEGEKCAEAAAALMPHYVAIAWAGGSNAWRKTDWTPLQGRRNVLLWPDLDRQRVENENQAKRHGLGMGELLPRDDQPGMRAMWGIGHAIKSKYSVETVKIIIAEDDALPDGFDVADAVGAGWTWEQAKAWILPRVKLIGANDDDTNGNGKNSRARPAPPDTQGARDSGAVERDHQATGSDDRRTRAQHESAGEPGRTHSGPTPRPGGDGGGDAESGSDDPNAGETSASGEGVRRGDSDGLQTRADGANAQAATSGPQGRIAKWAAWSLVTNGNGQPLPNANNAMRVVMLDASLAGIVWRDEFLGRMLTTYRTGEVHEWAEADSLALQFYMQDAIGIDRMGLDTVKGAVKLASERDIRNCVKEYVERTPWDKTPRIDTMMHEVYHCADTPYTRAVSKNFWIAMIARVYQPGCKADNMVVLEGAQGIYKSTSLSIIGGEWFAEQHESAADPKAFAEILQGKLLIEITEMDSFSRTEVTRIKSAITTQRDRYRIPYESGALDHPRRCVMVGTTNKDDWQRDETGGRRFWPIACKGLADTAKLSRERDQLFAEALSRYQAGEPWHEVPDVEAKAEQAKRFEGDAWADTISRWLVGKTETTIMQIAERCLDIKIKDVDMAEQRRIGKVLRWLGWEKVQRKVGRENIKMWIPPGDAYGQMSLEVARQDDEVARNELPENDIPFN